jgi:hypothetical protein
MAVGYTDTDKMSGKDSKAKAVFSLGFLPLLQ